MKTPTTLYDKIMQLENADEELKKIGAEPIMNLPTAEKILFEIYNKYNPILSDAILGVKSIESTLEDLGKKNKGLNRYLPWRKDEKHNERVKSVGQLIKEPSGLNTYGLLAPDNVFAGFGYVALASFMAGVVVQYGLSPACGIQPGPNFCLNQVVPGIAALMIGLPFGFALNTGVRPKAIPIDQARYLDGKIKELYSK